VLATALGFVTQGSEAGNVENLCTLIISGTYASLFGPSIKLLVYWSGLCYEVCARAVCVQNLFGQCTARRTFSTLELNKGGRKNVFFSTEKWPYLRNNERGCC